MDFFSSIGDLFGGAPNNAGTVAQAAPLIQPVTQQQVNNGTNTATSGINSTQDLIAALSAQGGINNQSNVYGQQQALANQYGQIASGVGPNPAQAALEQATGVNVANQAALAASQRGSGANVGLIARQVGQNGANIQQQAAGQGATLQAQQQLAALGAEGQQQNNLANLATTQVGQQVGATNALNTAAEQNQSSLLNALQGYNTNQVASTASQNSANAGIANNNANNTANTEGGLFNGLGGAAALAFAAEGGEIQTDGTIDHRDLLQKVADQKNFPDHLKGMAQIYHPKVLKMAMGGMAEGAVVPGNPEVPGKNTLKNDVVPAMLTPKEIVLPLSVTQSKNPGEAARIFVEEIKAKEAGSGDLKKAVREHIKNRKSKA